MSYEELYIRADRYALNAGESEEDAGNFAHFYALEDNGMASLKDMYFDWLKVLDEMPKREK